MSLKTFGIRPAIEIHLRDTMTQTSVSKSSDGATALSLDVENGVATLTMSRPSRRNPFTEDFKEEIAQFLRVIQGRDDVDVLILTGSDGVFSAGGDVSGMGARARGGAPPPDYDRRRVYALHGWLQLLRNIEIPTIAAVDGPAYGGGFGLALCCDFVLATPRAKFCSVFGRIGLVPDCSVLFTLPRIVGSQRAKEIMFTSRTINAKEALDLGIVLELHDANALMPAVQKLAVRMQAASRVALGATKRIVNQAFDLDANALIEMEASAQALCLASEYHKAAAIRFVEKQPPLFDWDRFEKNDT